MQFVLFHGSAVGPKDAWFPWLKEKLEAQGNKVLAPQFPTNRWEELVTAEPGSIVIKQTLFSWIKLFKSILPKIDREEKLCFIGHSIGSLFILHLVEALELKLDLAIFVCPFLEPTKSVWQIQELNKTFFNHKFDFRKLRKLISASEVIYSDNDPYVSQEAALRFARKIHSHAVLVKGVGHMGLESGLRELPLLLEKIKLHSFQSKIHS